MQGDCPKIKDVSCAQRQDQQSERTHSPQSAHPEKPAEGVAQRQAVAAECPAFDARHEQRGKQHDNGEPQFRSRLQPQARHVGETVSDQNVKTESQAPVDQQVEHEPPHRTQAIAADKNLLHPCFKRRELRQLEAGGNGGLREKREKPHQVRRAGCLVVHPSLVRSSEEVSRFVLRHGKTLAGSSWHDSLLPKDLAGLRCWRHACCWRFWHSVSGWWKKACVTRG